MATKVVTGKLTTPDGVAIAGGIVSAVLSVPAVIAGTLEVVPAAVQTKSALDGTYSLTLQANADLNPVGYYTIIQTIPNVWVSSTFTIVVPQTAGPFPISTIMTSPVVGPVWDATLLHLAGTEHVTGQKIFDTNPVLNAAAFPESAVANLTADLAAKAADASVVHLAGAETLTGVKHHSVLQYFDAYLRSQLFQYLREAFTQKTNVVNPQQIQPVITAALSPALVAANTTAEQTLAVPALQVGDTIVSVSKPTAQAGLGIVGWRVPSAGNIAITFSNNTGAGITPTAAESYAITINRQSQVMPAITLGAASGATSIAGSVNIAPNNPAFLYSGAKTMTYGTGFPDNTYYYAPRSPFSLTSTPVGLQQFIVHFMFDGSQFELYCKGVAGGKYRIKVDGMWVQPTATFGPNIGDGNAYRILVNFGSKANRRISIYMGGNAIPFGGIWCLPTDSVWKPLALPYRAIFFGDSEIQTAADGVGRTWGEVASDLLGWGDPIVSSAGGTGYLNDGGGAGKTTFRTRVANDLIAMAPDIVVIQGGQNDYGNFTNGQVQAEATLLLQAIQAGLPNAVIYGVAPAFFAGASNAPSGQSAFCTALAAGYAAAISTLYPSGVPFFDTVNDPPGRWFTGTGYGGATNGSGNSDFYISTDRVHPTQAGHDYMGLRFAASVLGQLQAP